MIFLLLVFALFLILLGVYIYKWVRRMLPASVNRIVRGILTAVLLGLSFLIFSTPGMALAHFWVISMLWELILRLCRVNASRVIRFSVPALLTAAVVLLGFFRMSHPVQTRYTYETDKVSRSYRILLLTDTHYDTIQKTEVLQNAIPEMNAQQPDIVILAGDIVEEGTSAEKMREAFSVLGSLESRLGSYYVFGNHDRQTYSRNPKYTVAELEQTIRENGIEILKNKCVTLDDAILLVGMEDPSWHREYPRMAAAEILVGEDLSKLVIFADHQPNDWRASSAAGMDLQVSGHTHAGQIWPAGHILELVGGLSYGRYDRDGCTAIVSSGFTGWGFPIRTSEKCEYVVIDIVPSK